MYPSSTVPEPITHHTASSAVTTASTGRGRHQPRGRIRTRGSARSAAASRTNRVTSPARQIAARAIFQNDGVVVNRLSAVSESASRPLVAVAAGSSVKIPATSGRTSPGRRSTGVPSRATTVAVASDPSARVQSPVGRGTVPRSAPALVIRTPAGVPTSRSPSSGNAAGSGRGGTVDSSSPPVRAAAQPMVAVSSTGW